jgi:CRISPR-associated protein Cmr3
VRWPAVAVDGSKRSVYVLTTPGRFAKGWQPDAPPEGASLPAASVPGHGAVSGWDLAKGGPKPTRFTVPAGSVYFFDNDTSTNLETFSNTPDNLREGWGLVLRGVWDYA